MKEIDGGKGGEGGRGGERKVGRNDRGGEVGDPKITTGPRQN